MRSAIAILIFFVAVLTWNTFRVEHEAFNRGFQEGLEQHRKNHYYSFPEEMIDPQTGQMKTE